MTGAQERQMLKDIHSMAKSLKIIADSCHVEALEPAIGFAVETAEKEEDKED